MTTADDSSSSPHEDSTPATGPARPQRPATLVFTQAVLGLQAFVALFATLVAWSFAYNGILDASPAWVAGGGILLMLLFGYAAGQQRKRWGRWLGWVLEGLMLTAGLLLPAVAIIGAVFLVLWIMALRLGGRIDRERKERDARAAEPEATVEGQADGRAQDAGESGA